MASTSPKTLFDLPLEDILVDNVGKYLVLEDIYMFGKCSKDCKVLANAMAAAKSYLLLNDFEFFDIPDTQLTDFMSWVSQNCRHLRKIMVFTHAVQHNQFLTELLNNNPQLESFCAGSFEDSGTRIIPLLTLATRKKITELTLVHIFVDNEFLIKLTENNNQLRRINFSWSTGFSEDVLLKLLEKQPHLEHINLKHCDIYFSDIDSFLSAIRNTCPKLEMLDIANVKGVTKADIS